MLSKKAKAYVNEREDDTVLLCNLLGAADEMGCDIVSESGQHIISKWKEKIVVRDGPTANVSWHISVKNNGKSVSHIPYLVCSVGDKNLGKLGRELLKRVGFIVEGTILIDPLVKFPIPSWAWFRGKLGSCSGVKSVWMTESEAFGVVYEFDDALDAILYETEGQD